ncbi:YitT family protein [Paenibacillus sp. M1]|uniref:YitT family protein n=1 Tax=Paenibacillus haidiansis TaxID=1574488 RepID=A0ABU7VXF1_9BACL
MKNKLTADSPMNEHRHRMKVQPAFVKFTGVIIGAVLAAVGLELFLMPHGIVVGGVTGLSALFALSTEMRLGLFLFLLNLPLLVLGRKNADTSFTIFTACGLLVLSLVTILLHPFPALMGNPLPAALAGGISLGLGIGLALRFGGALDTAEKAAEKAAERFRNRRGLSPEVLLLLLNCSILLAAGFHFGFEQAVYSVTAYILAYETVKIPLFGIGTSVIVRIESREYAAVQRELALYLNRDAEEVRSLPDRESGDPLRILKYKCHRLEAPRLKAIAKNCDPACKISTGN